MGFHFAVAPPSPQWNPTSGDEPASGCAPQIIDQAIAGTSEYSLGYADECYAHRGCDARLGPSTFDFSVGYALMAREELHARYGDAWIDVARRRGVGIDGCTVREVRVNGQMVDVLLDDKVARSAPPEIALANASAMPVRVLMDGKSETTVSPGTVRANLRDSRGN
jgi:hypothetical protein